LRLSHALKKQLGKQEEKIGFAGGIRQSSKVWRPKLQQVRGSTFSSGEITYYIEEIGNR